MLSNFPGACLCEQLRFEIEPPTKWCAHCHCTMCRRAHGAALVTWIGVELERFRLLQQETLKWFESSPGAQRGFCDRCGSTLLFQSSRWPGEMHVVRAAISGQIDREPSAHVFGATRVPWFPFHDALPWKN
jgi:hypothetical protein